jgi:RNA polymerase sigma factor (TIGR02999 family)
MSPQLTQILSQLDPGDPSTTEKLLPIVYDELRSLALARMAGESKGHTLQATALVHEAFLRLVDSPLETCWDSRAHFFAAASEAMRRILVERARAKKRLKRGGSQWKRIDLGQAIAKEETAPDLILAVSDALEHLAVEDPQLAELVKLRCFAGFSLPEAAGILGLPQSTAYVRWEYAKSRLRCLL